MSNIKEIIAGIRTWEKDCDPDDYPVVQMKEVAALCNEVERLDKVVERMAQYIVMERMNQHDRDKVDFCPAYQHKYEGIDCKNVCGIRPIRQCWIDYFKDEEVWKEN